LRLKLFIIGCAGIPARYGGFETFAENLGIRLSIDFEVYITCSSKFYINDSKQKKWNNINRIFIPIRPNGIQSLLYDFVSLKIALTKADFIILLGSGSGLMLPLFRIFNKLPLAIHIDGLEWKRRKWNHPTKAFLWLNYRMCLKFSKYIIVDNAVLIRNIPEKYKSKIVSISYGCEHIPENKINTPFSDQPYALVISRAEQENNLDMIIDAFKSLSNLNLIIISNCKYTSYGRWLLKKTKEIRNVQMIGPIYDNRELLLQYRMGCSLYIHGHSAGGTNPSLIEAMATGKPILAHDNDFNRVTTNNMAYYFKDAEALCSLLKRINDNEFLISAQNLMRFSRNEYSWDMVSQAVADLVKKDQNNSF
jgi:glycosyltransferase involved in cell wall biosynthesis